MQRLDVLIKNANKWIELKTRAFILFFKNAVADYPIVLKLAYLMCF